MSRKKASFLQLIDYMNKELSSPHTIGHNLYMGERTTEAEIIQEFEKNAEHLPQRKNGNYLYHEVISFEKNDLDQEKMDEIIIELAELYLLERAPKQLAYAVIHRDTEKPHIHFCISANELGEEKRKRLTKKKFADLQKNLERYALEKFPELESKLVYTKQRDGEKAKTTSREQELKKRTGRVSQKDILKNKMHGLFELSNTKKELDEHLEKEGYAIYTRGKNAGIEKIETGKKHRLTTLGVMEHYLSALERFDSLEKEKRQQAQTKQQAAEQRVAGEQRLREEQDRQAQLRAEQQKATEEAHRQAELERQATLLAEQERASREALRRSQRQKEAEQVARQKTAEQEQPQPAQQNANQDRRPDQAQREEYAAEKAAEQKRRAAFLSRQGNTAANNEKEKRKPSKTHRRQRTDQVRTAEDQVQPVGTPKSQRPEKARSPELLFQKERSKKAKQRTATKGTEHPEEKAGMFQKKTQDEILEAAKKTIEQARSSKEQDALIAKEQEKIMRQAPNTKVKDQIRDRLGELSSIFKKKSKNKDRER